MTIRNRLCGDWQRGAGIPYGPSAFSLAAVQDGANPTEAARIGGMDRRTLCDQRYENAWLFGSICPAHGKAAGLALPFTGTTSMQLHIDEISRCAAHAAILLDSVDWHTTPKLKLPRGSIQTSKINTSSSSLQEEPAKIAITVVAANALLKTDRLWPPHRLDHNGYSNRKIIHDLRLLKKPGISPAPARQTNSYIS